MRRPYYRIYFDQWANILYLIVVLLYGASAPLMSFVKWRLTNASDWLIDWLTVEKYMRYRDSLWRQRTGRSSWDAGERRRTCDAMIPGRAAGRPARISTARTPSGSSRREDAAPLPLRHRRLSWDLSTTHLAYRTTRSDRPLCVENAF